jgi:hypothetical protein
MLNSSSATKIFATAPTPGRKNSPQRAQRPQRKIYDQKTMKKAEK